MNLLFATDVLVPDGDEARERAQDELSRAEYQAATPTWFDRLAADVAEWFFGLFRGDGAGAVAPVAVTIIVIIIVAALLVALAIWGRPRASRSVRRRAELLGEQDDRTAAQLRAEADRRAKAHDWDGAVVLRFRALARSLIERDVIEPAPGATAQAIAREASVAFPGFGDRLHSAATAFDAVRYLDRPSDATAYRVLAETDDDVRATTPTDAATPAVPA
ncbi:DUF4129 domain-containing protein [Microbacterium esteraromaticum]|uniref:DUF4129 domain-containing protein n=1 Tax=Microbacterium esteraromaticum TaxID=57043 RepID=UPI001A8FC25C|nr:DUF4129 domain-containing protein [Microbacterium esteraromaticum]MBN8423780.1 DUF4129 domain-containing protein [Microbacterium esteraromaticum]